MSVAIIFKLYNIDNDKLIYITGTTQSISKKIYDIKHKTKNSIFAKYVNDNLDGDFTKFKSNIIKQVPYNNKLDFEKDIYNEVIAHIDKGFQLINDVIINKNLTLKNKNKVYLSKKSKEELDKIKEDNNKYQKKYYDDNIKNSHDYHDYKLPILKPLKQITILTKKPKFAESTIKQYTYIIKKIYKFYNDKDIDDDNEIFKYLNNLTYKSTLISSSFKFLKTNIKNVIKDFTQYITAIYSIFIHITGFKVMLKHLAPYKDHVNDEYYKTRNDFKPPDDAIRKITFNKPDVLKLLSDNDKLDNKFKLIFGLYSLIPPKRPNDYRIMKISKSNDITKFNKSFNYIYKDDDDSIKMIFFKLKSNKNSYKNQPILFPIELYDFINWDNQYLFQFNNDVYSQNGFGKLINNTFNKFYGYPYRPTMLRKIYTTTIKDLPIDERKEIAKIMNHSLEQQLLYSY